MDDFWSGLGSSIVGGVVGALTVVLGAWLAYLYGEKSRRADRLQDDERKAAEERRAAAAQLMVELSNLRDAVCSRHSGLEGTAALHPMRNALFTTHVPLRKYPSYRAVREFYDTSMAWRRWVRHTQRLAPTPAELVALYPVVNEYREALRAYGHQVITVLQDHLEDKNLAFSPPTMPDLPELPAETTN